MKWYMMLTEFNTISMIVRIFLAMLLGGFIGLEREKSKRPAGFRTHILVCVGSCMTALIGLFVWMEFGHTADPMRISAQVISGIGFLGVGTILVKEHDHITGLTTAAGLWTTAAILFKFEARGRKKNRKYTIYMEVQGTDLMNEYIDWLAQEWKAKNVLVVPPRTAIGVNVGLEVVLPFVGNEDGKEVLEKLRKKEGVLFVYDMFMMRGNK